MFSNTKTTGALIIIMAAAIIALTLIVIFMGQRLSKAESHLSQNGELTLLLHESNQELIKVSQDHNASIKEIYLILESKN